MLVGSGGGAILGTLLVGLMVVYVLDVLELAEAALLSAWCTLLAVYVAACAGSDLFDGRRSPAVSLLLLLVNGECLFLAGLCVTLQFRWVRVSFPGVTIAAERCVFAAAPLACGASAAWTVVAAFGAANGPFYLAGIFAALYRAFSFPTPSSFKSHRGSEPGETVKGANDSDSTREMDASASLGVLSRREAATHAAAFVFVPFFSYAAANAPRCSATPSSPRSNTCAASRCYSPSPSRFYSSAPNGDRCGGSRASATTRASSTRRERRARSPRAPRWWYSQAGCWVGWYFGGSGSTCVFPRRTDTSRRRRRRTDFYWRRRRRRRESSARGAAFPSSSSRRRWR